MSKDLVKTEINVIDNNKILSIFFIYITYLSI